MLLLTSLAADSLDQGYARAAARRTRGEAPPRHGVWIRTAGLLAVGLLLATAAARTHDLAGAVARTHRALSDEIEQRTADNDRAERILARQRAAVTADRTAALRLTSEGARLAALLTTLESVTGAAPVRGPGLVVHLQDSAPADPPEDGLDPEADPADGRVTDRDLQTVVNEVWAAGAEAVAVNGQRLTSLSSIRSAGEAILVDFRPLSPPYDVAAVGDPGHLRDDFLGGFGGSYLQALREYGITYSVEDEDEVTLPASAALGLRHAAVPADRTGS